MKILKQYEKCLRDNLNSGNRKEKSRDENNNVVKGKGNKHIDVKRKKGKENMGGVFFIKVDTLAVSYDVPAETSSAIVVSYVKHIGCRTKKKPHLPTMS